MTNRESLDDQLNYLHKLVNRNKIFLFFIFVFILYLILSVGVMKYISISETKINFMGVDEARVLNDMFGITGLDVNHYRIKVHPLFLLFVQPFLHIINGLVHDVGVTVALGQSIVGLTTCICTYRILKVLNVHQLTATLLTAIFSLSFSQIVFVSNAESFIWGGMTTALCWLYLISQRNHAENIFKGKLLSLLLFLGILCFGITITNYVHFIVALLFILRIASFSFKNKVFLFLKMNVLCLSIATLLNILECISWRHETGFWLRQFYIGIFQKLVNSTTFSIKNILPYSHYNKIQQELFEEVFYMDFTISLSKIQMFIDQLLTSSILSRPITTKGLGTSFLTVYFEGYTLCSIVLIILFFVILLFSCIYFAKQTASSNIDYILLQMLMVVLLFNFLLHFIYGAHEAFMYTPHFLYIIFIIYGIVSKSWNPKFEKYINSFFILFLIYELYNNLYYYNVIRRLLIIFLSIPPYSMLNVSAGVLLVFVLCYAVLYKGYKYKELFFAKRTNNVFSVDTAYDLMLCLSSICILSMTFVFICVFTEY